MKNIISVAALAFIGGSGRYLFSQWWGAGGILAANLIGCFVLAFLTYYIIERGLLAGWLNTGIGTGMIGAFTTFSSFATLTIKEGASAGLLYFLASAIGGLACAYLGFILARVLTRKEETR